MNNTIDYLRVLRNEFEAAEGSFLIRIRTDLNWERESFTRLITSMQRCCEEYSDSETLDRWMAEGFWYVPSFVRDWTTHPNFPRIHEPEYYQRAYQRLDDLSYWFFLGESPRLKGTGFEPL
ncbi:MAG TPA: hypothetical protein VFJ58_13110 [Armatimonadota bacterium]|nr:hypothetical protein [Armatimonadota bacterium]